MKIAIIGEIHSEGWKTLKKYNCNAFEIVNFEKNNLKKELKDVDVTIIRAALHLTANILEGCNNIKIIARHGVGYDNIDLEYLNQNNIALGVTGTSNAVSVAEQVLTSFLYLTKNIHQSDQLTRSGGFNKKSSLHMNVDKEVVSFFLNNSSIMFLIDDDKRILPSPIACYYGNNLNYVKAISVFGVQKASLHTSKGPFYYFGNYNEALKSIIIEY